MQTYFFLPERELVQVLQLKIKFQPENFRDQYLQKCTSFLIGTSHISGLCHNFIKTVTGSQCR